MKKMILTMALSAFMLSVSAQITERRMATLVDGDATKVFYGEDAIKQAYEEAKDGATIIVSEGEFNFPEIKGKSAKFYGAGMDDNEDAGSLKTKVRGMSVKADKYYDEYGKEYYAYPKDLHIEGFSAWYFSVSAEKGVILDGLSLKKCDFATGANNYSSGISSSVKNSVIYQCAFGFLSLSGEKKDILVRNCWVGSLDMNKKDLKSDVIIDHCIIKTIYSNSVAYYTNNVVLDNRSQVVPADATAFNNIFVSKDAWNDNATGKDNWFGIAVNGIFAEEGEDGSYAPGKKFTLKYPKTYIATDGTEVGINGGVTPWNPVPALPRIMSSKIDNRVDSEGKINVSIKVEAQNRP